MKKRMRKKLFLNEYKSLGFELIIEVKKGTENDKIIDLLDDFIDFLDERDLSINARDNELNSAMLITSSLKYGSASNEDINACESWLKNKEIVKQIKIGNLIDSWYDESTLTL